MFTQGAHTESRYGNTKEQKAMLNWLREEQILFQYTTKCAHRGDSLWFQSFKLPAPLRVAHGPRAQSVFAIKSALKHSAHFHNP